MTNKYDKKCDNKCANCPMVDTPTLCAIAHSLKLTANEILNLNLHDIIVLEVKKLNKKR